MPKLLKYVKDGKVLHQNLHSLESIKIESIAGQNSNKKYQQARSFTFIPKLLNYVKDGKVLHNKSQLFYTINAPTIKFNPFLIPHPTCRLKPIHYWNGNWEKCILMKTSFEPTHSQTMNLESTSKFAL